MRIAVSGSHGTGKSTLIASFLDRCPHYRHEPEAFETLGDDVELTEAGEPTPEGLRLLLDYTVAALEGHGAGDCVVFERSPADYLAYAAASRGRMASPLVTVVRAAVRRLEVIAYLPVTARGIQGRPGEDARFRLRVDEWLRRVLLDDEYDLFDDEDAAEVFELPADPERQLAELLRIAQGRGRGREPAPRPK